jgi:hypothetical protein
MDEKKHKHRCAVRQLIMWRRIWGLKVFREYMRKHRFDWQLVRDFEDQWLKGNRADEKGEWK